MEKIKFEKFLVIKIKDITNGSSCSIGGIVDCSPASSGVKA